METCYKDIAYPDSHVFCTCKKCWDERNRKARAIHDAKIREYERSIKDYWLTFDAHKKTVARIRFRCDYEDNPVK